MNKMKLWVYATFSPDEVTPGGAHLETKKWVYETHFRLGPELSWSSSRSSGRQRGPLTRYVKLRVVHAPGMQGTFSPPPTSKETASKRSRHASRHVRVARAVMHVGIANPRWRGKCSRYSWRMHNPQFCVSGKRPIPSAPLWLSAPYFFKRAITIWLPGCYRECVLLRCSSLNMFDGIWLIVSHEGHQR